MPELRDSVADFLAQRRIAVAGVSRDGDLPANLIYRKLRDAGYAVFAVNPNADRAEGDPCWPDLASIPERVDAVVAATPPAATADVVRQCAELGVRRVWMHRSFGRGSVDEGAVEACREHGIACIPGSCPMMWVKPVDPAHACMRWVQTLTGGAPRPTR
jgi:predicted CoA-binding protein